MFDPEYIMTLYFVGDEALTQADVDQLSEWIGQSQKNAVKFIRASFEHRAIHDALVGASLKKSVLLDLAEEADSGDEVVMGSNVSLRGVEINDVLVEEEPEDTPYFNMTFWQEMLQHEQTAPETVVPKVKPPRELIQKVVYPPRQKRKISKFDKFFMITTAAAALFIFAFVKIEPLLNPDRIEVATLIDQAGAQWAHADSGQTLEAGARLRTHEELPWLQKGTARIRFDYGAEVIIEGPAEFELLDQEKMALHSGRLYATVGEGAAGFTTVTPTATIIDLGTEFGVEVGFDGATDVHMFEGKASLMPGESGRKNEAVDLLAGNAKRVNTEGQVRNIRLKEKAFVRPTQHQWRAKAAAGSAYHRWLLYSNRLRRDPSLVAYYTFEDDPGNRNALLNAAGTTSGQLTGIMESDKLDGEMPQWTEGRWAGKGALHFDENQQHYVRVKTDPSICISENVSIAAWVKCDTKAGKRGGVVLGCRTQDRVNYQISYYPRFRSMGFVSYMKYGDKLSHIQGKLLELDPLDTSWKFLVTVRDKGKVKFYLNGRMMDEKESEWMETPVKADLLIGSTLVHRSSEKERFSGLLDEVAIFNRALTDREVAAMYEAGQPD